MPNTNPLTRDRLWERLERLAAGQDWQVPPALAQAAASLLTAMDYEDRALIRSHLHATLEAVRDLVQDAIRIRLGLPLRVTEAWDSIQEELKGCPVENVDDFGRSFQEIFDALNASLTEFRDGVVRKIEARGYAVENAPQLQSVIEELSALRAKVIGTWPWSDRELPPVDRNMVAESRAAIRRREGERVEDMIRRLGGDVSAPRP